MMHTDANIGFAIEPLEQLFYRLGLTLGDEDPANIHFTYPSLERGFPRCLPRDTSVQEFRCQGYTEQDLNRLLKFVREKRINFVLMFDQQPVAPIYSRLREAGVDVIMSYWGAEISSRNPSWKLAIKRALLRLSRSRLDGLVFESKAMADLARFGRGVPDSMIDVVPLGIDCAKFSSAPPNYVNQVFGIDTRKRIIVYAGHMEERKGVHVLVRAAMELFRRRRDDDVVLLIFGNREGEAERFRYLYGGDDLSQRIVFGGYRSDLHLCFPGCSIGVIPSSGWDSFPRTALEFAASGLPLVVTRLGGLPETIAEGSTGLLCNPGDHLSLADAINALLDQPTLAMQMGANGRKRCEQEFNLERQFEQLLSCVRARLVSRD